MMKRISIFAMAVALIGSAACTIDARPEADEPDEFTLAYTAPPAATWVSFCSNFDAHWACSERRDGRTFTWTGEFDAVRLQYGADSGGYVFNLDLPSAPHHAVTQDGLGGFLTVGNLGVSGPLPIVVEPVDNGQDGGNWWVHLAD